MESEPYRRFIIKLSFPRSAKREEPPCSDHSMDSRSEKRRKVFDSSNPVITGYWVDRKYKHGEPKKMVTEVIGESKNSTDVVAVCGKDSRTGLMADQSLAVVKPKMVWMKQTEEAKLKTEAEKDATAFEATLRGSEKTQKGYKKRTVRWDSDDSDEYEDLARKPIGPH